MLAYAAPRPGREAAHPKTLLLIVAGHALGLAAVMLAKSDLPRRIVDGPIVVDTIPLPKDPPPLPPPPTKADPAPSRPIATQPVIDLQPLPVDNPVFPATTPNGPIEGTGTVVLPETPVPPSPPLREIVRRGPQFATPESLLRPPYPDSKRMMGEEATLTLKLSIDERGRVVAVEPVGQADRAFLASARSHLMRSWRFQPATEDGAAVASTKVVTLHFQLDED